MKEEFHLLQYLKDQVKLFREHKLLISFQSTFEILTLIYKTQTPSLNF